MRYLYTIGYEKTDREVLVATLLHRGVQTVLDVRERPASRRLGFSKEELSRFLEEKGIEYRHLPELGTPSHVRRRLRETGDVAGFNRQYLGHLHGCFGLLQQLSDMVEERSCCLLCYERIPSPCHRHILANELVRLDGGSIEVIDL